ncbi:MAG: hypothetical protein ABEJ65_02150, partial [bacterium]
EICEEIESLERRKEELSSEFQKIKRNEESLEASVQEIRRLGAQYTELIETETECPLCGHDHKTTDKLTEHIEDQIGKSLSSEESEAEKELSNIKDTLSELQDEKKEYEKRKENNKSVHQAFEKLKDEKEKLFLEIPDDDGIEQVFGFISEIFNLRNDKQEEIQNLKKRLKEGLNQHLKEMAEDKLDLEDDASQIDIDGIQEKYRTRIEKLEDEKKSLNELLRHFEILSDEFEIYEVSDLKEWLLRVGKCKKRLESAQDQLEDKAEIERLKNEKEKLGKEIEELTEWKEKCNEVLKKAFGKLTSLDEIVQDFIENKKESIEFFFKWIHTPREFEHIDIDSGEELMVKREGDSEPIPAWQMSTGQRASLALSIMLTMHISAPNAPRILFMDEPVANMDDMHLLNLIDILRDLAING